MTESEYQKQLAERGNHILKQVADAPTSIYACHALFELDENTDLVEDVVKRVFGGEKAGAFGRIAAGTFDVFAVMHLASRWTLSDATLDHIRKIMTRGVHHRGNTENHWLMYYVGNLLAAEKWPNEPTFWNGLSPHVVREEAMRWLLGMADRTARMGHHEYDSTQYHGWHVTPWIALADHAQDETLREQAQKMATLLIADMALEYFAGAWAGGHSREGYRENTWHYVGTSSALMYYYFGDPHEDVQVIQTQAGMCPAVTAHYQPPVLLCELARERAVPQVVKKTKAPRAIYRHIAAETKPVRKYTYLSRSFALGSSQLGLPGAPASPIDLISWDLTWDKGKHQGKVAANHPYLDAGRFSAFLSEAPQSIRRNVASPKPYLQNPDRLFGASPYEKMMQCDAAMIILYRIPEDDETPYVNVFLPRDVNWVEENGWVIGNMTDFYVGLRPIGPYRWESIAEDDHVDGWLLRIEDIHAGLVVEAMEADEAGSFDDFCDAIAARDLDLNHWKDQGVVRYSALNGHRLKMAYDGAHWVDDVEIDYDAWPLYDGVGVSGKMGSGVVVFEKGDQSLTLDFDVDETKDMIPMRVVG